MKPSEIAHSLGRGVTDAAGKGTQKDLGQFMTPLAVAHLTARQLVAGGVGRSVRVLEPSAGGGVLACAVCEALLEAEAPPAVIELTLYEIDRAFEASLVRVLESLRAWLAANGIELKTSVKFEDYVLANAHGLDMGLFGSCQQFDLIIANPPYFKVAKNAPQALACASIVHGQPNAYGFFMAIAAAGLASGGRLAFIVPRSFASGQYFRKFRERFFGEMRPESVHVFHSRTDAFAEDEVLQENVVFLATKATGWNKAKGTTALQFTVTASQGLSDLETPELFRLPLSEVLNLSSKDKVLCIPSTSEEVEIFHRIKHWTGNLRKFGWEISTGPVVPFRATELIVDDAAEGTVPLLWMQNVQYMQTSWPVVTRKAQHLLDNEDSANILLPNRNYVLMRRFSPKEQARRLMSHQSWPKTCPAPALDLRTISTTSTSRKAN